MKKILSFLFIILISFSNIAYAKEFVATSEYDAYNKALVYLGEVAYGNEFVKAEDKLRRFEKPINIFLQGKLTKEDEAFAKQFVADLNRKVPRMPLVSFTKKDKANVIVSYVPLKDMKKYSPYYVENNWGFASYWWNNKSEITKIEIAIAIDVTNQKERNHLFMEEILNSFACPNDSYT
ncbi:MAG: DUF2927 domain-containing protein, partial [Christensenellaceae bacterium]|nr:DUF2927 domain-containing protein [Christensenellaceae bacterium]